MAKGFWIGDDLHWQIGEETVSDRDLQIWIRANMPNWWHPHDGVIRQKHTAAYAARVR